MPNSHLLGLKIAGTGSCLPGERISNADLQCLDADSGKVFTEKTGIVYRHYVSDDQATSDLCIKATQQAMEMAEITKDEIDLIIVATISPDYLCPSTANVVQKKLGAKAASFDINAACAGFVNALVTGAHFAKSGKYRNVLAIGADCLSTIIPHDSPGMTPLFGDGAGAAIIQPTEDLTKGIIDYALESDGEGVPLLLRKTGGSRHPLRAGDVITNEHFLAMEGRPVFKWAVSSVARSVNEITRRNLDTSIDWLVLHQANKRIIDGVASRIEIPAEKLAVNIEKCANTSAASVPICLDQYIREEKIQDGAAILLSGFGAGLSLGSALIRL